MPIYSDLLPVPGAVGPGTVTEHWRNARASQQERADVTIYYPTGMASNAPTIAGGILTLKQLAADGSTVRTYNIPYASILRGSVLERAATTAAKKRISMRIMNETDVDRLGSFGVTIKPHPSRLNDYNYFVTPFTFSVDISQGLSTDDRLNAIARDINLNGSSPVVATVDLTNNLLFLEAKEAGNDFEISSEGFYPEDILQPSQFTSFTINDFRATEIPTSVQLAETNGAKPLKALVFKTREYKPKGGVGIGTSSTNSDTREYEVFNKSWIVLFDGADTNSNAAYTALKGHLTLSNVTTVAVLRTYLATAPETLAADNTTTNYQYTVTRADTVGGPTQQATAQSDYASAGTVTFKSNNGTNSYYEIKSTSSTTPTAVGSDKVTPGKYGADNTDPVA